MAHGLGCLTCNVRMLASPCTTHPEPGAAPLTPRWREKRLTMAEILVVLTEKSLASGTGPAEDVRVSRDPGRGLRRRGAGHHHRKGEAGTVDSPACRRCRTRSAQAHRACHHVEFFAAEGIVASVPVGFRGIILARNRLPDVGRVSLFPGGWGVCFVADFVYCSGFGCQRVRACEVPHPRWRSLPTTRRCTDAPPPSRHSLTRPSTPPTSPRR